MRPVQSSGETAGIWEIARAGDLRGAIAAARGALGHRDALPAECVELLLVSAFCAMRQGQHADALRNLDAAAEVARSPQAGAGPALRVDVWRAELAYFQGRYSDANGIVERALPELEHSGDLAYAALALRVRIAILHLLVIGGTDFGSVVDASPPAQQQLGREINPKVFSLGEWKAKLRSKDSFVGEIMRQPKIFLIGQRSQQAPDSGGYRSLSNT